MSIDGIIFKQESLGKNAKPFTQYKIRTMTNSVLDYASIIKKNGVDSYGKVKNDPRVTTFGAFLRKFWIDELPQVYNILKGEMKLVGVRPRPETFWSLYPKSHKEKCLQVKPGLFGVPYIQKSPSFDRMIEIESNYVDEYLKSPLKTDIKYFAKITNSIIFKGARSL